MIRIKSLTYSLLCATAIGALTFSHPAAAQTDAQIQTIQQQIKQLQNQLNQMKSELTARDRAVKAAQQQAKEAQDQAAAAQGQAASASSQAAQVAAAVPPPQPPMPPGQFRAGPLTVTLGGFAAVEGIYRSRNLSSSIDTNFNAIPFPNNPNYHINEFRETAQQSRFSLMTEGQIDAAQKLTGYMETDFLSAGSSSNSNQSNSYTLRLRQFWGNYDNTDWGLHVLGGQAWSLATMYKVGLVPRQENIPLTIDAQYVVGFNWERQPQLRVVKDFDNHMFWAGLSIEEPQTLFSSTTNCFANPAVQPATAAGGGTLQNTQCGGSNVNSLQAYSDNSAPDIIAKIAADPGFGHYELYGLLRFFDGRTSFAAAGQGISRHTTGQGIGGGMILPVIPKMLDFQISGLVGQGVGRYGTSQIADATFGTTGAIKPLSEYSIMGGFVGHPIPTVDIYAYGGAESADRKPYGTTGGYGNPAVNLSGCSVELGSCSAVTSTIIEGTVGAWWRVIKSPYGTAQVGAQYEWVGRSAFQGVGAGRTTAYPSSNENMLLFSVRYLPFQ